LDWWYWSGLPDHVDITHLYNQMLNLEPDKRGIYHYMVIAHSVYYVPRGELALGMADINRATPGPPPLLRKDGLKMGIAGYGLTPPLMARIFMHELGHNLGLYHSIEWNGDDLDPFINPTGWETATDTVMYYSAVLATYLRYLDDEWDISDGDGIDLSYGLTGISSIP